MTLEDFMKEEIGQCRGKACQFNATGIDSGKASGFAMRADLLESILYQYSQNNTDSTEHSQKWLVEFEVNNIWVADGFNLDDERALDMLSGDLRFANIGTELEAKVIQSPNPETITGIQSGEIEIDEQSGEIEIKA